MSEEKNRKRQDIFKEMGFVTEDDLVRWRRNKRYPVLVRHNLPAQIPAALMDNPNRKDKEVRLYGMLSRIGSEGQTQIYQEDIARRLGCCVRTLQRILVKLKASGWVSVRKIGFGFPDIIYLNQSPFTF